MMQGRVFRAGLCALLALVVCGCAASVDERKSTSMESLQVRDVAGVDVATFARTHGADEVTGLRLTKGNVEGLFRRNGEVCRTVGGGAAVPIDQRGYWLTAAHCVASGAALIVLPATDGSERAVPARIVWKGDRPGQDIALLFAPFADAMVPADVSNEVRMRARVVCVGSGIAADRISAGRVVGVGGSTDGTLVSLEHDAPLTFGDSGGPAFYDDGQLAGLNVEAGSTFSGDRSRATAILPNMEQIQQAINDDWSSHARSK